MLVALAIKLLPGDGGHIPAKGLAAGGSASPRVLPGVILAGLAAVGFGLVLGPEGPLIALGAGVAVLLVSLSGRDLEGVVRFTFSPSVLDLEPGQSATAQLQVQAPKPEAGQQATRQLTIVASDGGSEVEATAT